MTATDEIRNARAAIWETMPRDVARIVDRRDILQPAGHILYSEGMTREAAELLFTITSAWKQKRVDDTAARAVLAVIVEHYAVGLGGFYALPEGAALLRLAAGELRDNPSTPDVQEMLDELRLYLTRLNLWIDLLVPWHEINELIRTTSVRFSEPAAASSTGGFDA
jgi:hypothetical protein